MFRRCKHCTRPKSPTGTLQTQQISAGGTVFRPSTVYEEQSPQTGGCQCQPRPQSRACETCNQRAAALASLTHQVRLALCGRIFGLYALRHAVMLVHMCGIIVRDRPSWQCPSKLCTRSPVAHKVAGTRTNNIEYRTVGPLIIVADGHKCWALEGHLLGI